MQQSSTLPAPPENMYYQMPTHISNKKPEHNKKQCKAVGFCNTKRSKSSAFAKIQTIFQVAYASFFISPRRRFTGVLKY